MGGGGREVRQQPTAATCAQVLAWLKEITEILTENPASQMLATLAQQVIPKFHFEKLLFNLAQCLRKFFTQLKTKFFGACAMWNVFLDFSKAKRNSKKLSNVLFGYSS